MFEFATSSIRQSAAILVSGAILLAAAGLVTSGSASAQSQRPQPAPILPAEMPVRVEMENGEPQCIAGRFTPANMADDGKPMIYPVHLGAGNDYLALDTARAGTPVYACDVASTQLRRHDYDVEEQRWVGVIYGPDLAVCTPSRGGNYAGPCRYGWVQEGFFDGLPSDVAVMAVNEESGD